MRASVIKLVESQETIQLAFYNQRQELWTDWKSTRKLVAILRFLLDGFIVSFEQHTKGAE